MMILSKTIMLFAAARMISVLALPVPKEKSPSNISIQAPVSRAIHEDFLLSKRMDRNRPMPLEPPTSSIGAHNGALNLRPPLGQKHPDISSVNIGGRRYELQKVYQGREPSVDEKIAVIKRSDFYLDDAQSELRDFLDRLFEDVQKENPKPEDTKLLNGYDILARAERQVNAQCDYKQGNPELGQDKSKVDAAIARIKRKNLEPDDMILIGLADPRNDGAYYLSGVYRVVQK
ncbi:hypothetical protein FB446DRAFT_502107 [Lentinula raphanica]|nr:hypothetical protein FB446DRAFT_502107 [Lentinula raphanica]